MKDFTTSKLLMLSIVMCSLKLAISRLMEEEAKETKETEEQKSKKHSESLEVLSFPFSIM